GYIERIEVIPDIDREQIRVFVHLRGAEGRQIGPVGAIVCEGDRVVASTYNNDPRGENPIVVQLKNSKLWSPDSPFLYHLEVQDGKKDKVTSYFAMRKISLGKDEQGVTRLMLNNKP